MELLPAPRPEADTPDITEINLRRALTGANLTDGYLVGANLTRAYLANAKLTSVSLMGANLTRAILIDADLTDARLTDLTGTALWDDAVLTDANFTGAKLTGAHWPPRARVPEGWAIDADSGRLTEAPPGSGSADAN